MNRPTLHLNRPPRFGITTLGPGSRVAIWLQGCTLACAGCVSRDTWALGGTPWDPEALAEALASGPAPLDGITISGGEPFEQADGLGALLRALRSRLDPEAVDILCYSGFRRAHLATRHPEVLGLLDVLVDGRYRGAEPTLLPYRGSANQRLHRLTPLAEARYADADVEVARPPMQVVVDPTGIELIGIPETGELDRLDAGLAEVGIALGGASWRA